MRDLQLTHDYMPFLIEPIVVAAATATLFLTLLLLASRHKLEEDSSAPTISFGQSSGGGCDFYGSIILLIAVITPLVVLNLGGNPWPGITLPKLFSYARPFYYSHCLHT